jgi:hypothetical protein
MRVASTQLCQETTRGQDLWDAAWLMRSLLLRGTRQHPRRATAVELLPISDAGGLSGAAVVHLGSISSSRFGSDGSARSGIRGRNGLARPPLISRELR